MGTTTARRLGTLHLRTSDAVPVAPDVVATLRAACLLWSALGEAIGKGDLEEAKALHALLVRRIEAAS